MGGMMKRVFRLIGMLVYYGYSVDSGETVYLGDIRRYKWMKLRKKVGSMMLYCTIDCENKTYLFSQKNLETGEETREEEMKI